MAAFFDLWISMKILFVSLGCDKNSVDSEVMLGVLSSAGYSFTDDEDEADVVIVNTCCFIGDAKKESIQNLIELGEGRLSGKYKALIATGCLAQRYAEDIHRDIPEVDALVGISSIDHIAEALDLVLKGTPKDFFDSLDVSIKGNKKRVMTTGGYYDYLKIAEGCNKRCTYCVIPSVRGNYRSVPMEDLIAEAKELVDRGVRELILVAQETTVYGVDLYGKKMLPKLLDSLCEIDDLEFIRILYAYPEEITDELIDVIKRQDKIVNYIDMPIQSGSDRILKLMGRRTTRKQIYDLVSKLRKNIPDICLRTTLISGFPTEDEKDFEDSLKMVSDLEFDRLGVFTYSREEDTPAATMKPQILQKVKKARQKKLMLTQQEITFRKNSSMVGREVKAIVEGYIPEDNIYVARTYRDAPDVDGYLFVSSMRELLSGEVIDVKVTSSVEYDLIGELV